MISSLCLQLHNNTPEWPPPSSQHMEEDNNTKLTMFSKTTSSIVTVWCEYWVPEGGEEHHCRCTFHNFTPSGHKERGTLEGHHSCPNAHNRVSSWFCKYSRVQKSYTEVMTSVPNNVSSHRWLARVKKGLSSTSTRLQNLQRSVQKMVYSARDINLSSLKSFITELFRPSMIPT